MSELVFHCRVDNHTLDMSFETILLHEARESWEGFGERREPVDQRSGL